MTLRAFLGSAGGGLEFICDANELASLLDRDISSVTLETGAGGFRRVCLNLEAVPGEANGDAPIDLMGELAQFYRLADEEIQRPGDNDQRFAALKRIRAFARARMAAVSKIGQA